MTNDLIRQSVQSLTGYVPGQQSSSREIIKLNTNENPYPPSQSVASALKNIDTADLLLYPNPVCADLRECISKMHGCSVANVFVGNGSDEILALCTRAFVENDGCIGYFDPSYSLYPVLAEIRDVEKKEIPLADDYSCVVSDECDCSLFYLANPNAPTGILMPHDEAEKLCSIVRGVVVIDEAYVDFSASNCMDLALEQRNVLVMRTLSKAYSLAGLRLGYVVGSSDLVDALYKIKDSYNVNRITQELALAALGDIEYMESNATKIKTTRARLSEALILEGFTVYPSESNFLWVKPKRTSAEELFEYLTEQGILVRYFPGERTGECLRITIGTDQDVDRLIVAVKGMQT